MLMSADDLVKCYEEIDQIYGYIRGFAPWPARLRRIKSIDYEQLEREQQRRLQQQQQQQQQQTSTRKTNVGPQTTSTTSNNTNAAATNDSGYDTNGNNRVRHYEIDSSTQRLPLIDWRQSSNTLHARPSINQPSANYLVASLQRPHLPRPTTTPNGISSKAAGRRSDSSRRMTAIGIEDALAGIRQANALELTKNPANRPNRHLNECSSSRHLVPNSPACRVSTRTGYFEPPQLTRAKLIDDQDEDEDEDEDCSGGSDTSATTTGSDGATTGSETATTTATATSTTESSASGSRCSSSTRRKQQIVKASQVSRNLLKKNNNNVRCLNSISDLHSFSSSSGESEEVELVKSSSSSQSARNNAISLITTSKSPIVLAKKRNTNDKRNDFVSSHSFIKCYYGKENDLAPRDAKTKEIEPTKQSTKQEEVEREEEEDEFDNKQVTKSKGKRKLLNLIGLNTKSSDNSSGSIKQSTSSDRSHRTQSYKSNKYSMSKSESADNKQIYQHQKLQQYKLRQQQQLPRPRVITSPIGAMFVASQLKPRRTSATASMATDRRSDQATNEMSLPDISLSRPDLVRHYQHPTVRITKVPSLASIHQHHQRLPQVKLSSRQAAETKLNQRFMTNNNQSVPMRRINADHHDTRPNNTRSSVSSYEVALKKGRDTLASSVAQLLSLDHHHHHHHHNQSSTTNHRSIGSKSSSNNSNRRTIMGSSRLSSSQNESQQQQHSNYTSNGTALIKVPRLSKQSYLLNRPLPKPPAPMSSLWNGLHHHHSTSSLNRKKPSIGDDLIRQRVAALAANQRRNHQAHATKDTGGIYSTISNNNLEVVVSSKRPQKLAATSTDLDSIKLDPISLPVSSSSRAKGSRSTLINGSSLSPLTSATYPPLSTSISTSTSTSVSAATTTTTTPSSAAATCTSTSGISSRLPSGNYHPRLNSSESHVAKAEEFTSSDNGSSVGRTSGSSASGGSCSGDKRAHTTTNRVKSLSELHKQRQQQQQQQQIKSRTVDSSNFLSSIGDSLGKQSKCDFALMDDSDDRELASSPEQPKEEEEEAGKLISAAAGQEERSPLPMMAKNKKPQRTSPLSDELTGENAFTSTKTGKTTKAANSLRLFDERFSARFSDQHLASSNDSLLESIDFNGGTLDRRRRRRSRLD